jgi:hypothetical protein
MRTRSNPPDGFLYPCDPHEVHHSLKTIAAEWGVDEETVRNVFINEPGIPDLGTSNGRGGKRQYRILRIPESVLQRVYKERTKR